MNRARDAERALALDPENPLLKERHRASKQREHIDELFPEHPDLDSIPLKPQSGCSWALWDVVEDKEMKTWRYQEVYGPEHASTLGFFDEVRLKKSLRFMRVIFVLGDGWACTVDGTLDDFA